MRIPNSPAGRTSPYREGEVGYKIWSIANMLYACTGEVKTEEVIELGRKYVGRSDNSLRTGLSHWRSYYNHKPAPQSEKNGVKYPRRGTVGAEIWAWADEVREKLGDDYKAIRIKMLTEAEERRFKGTNVGVELSGWRRYHGKF
ncbi:MAG: hypothetical protein ABI673_00325 [Novosphingobium sp.]